MPAKYRTGVYALRGAVPRFGASSGRGPAVTCSDGLYAEAAVELPHAARGCRMLDGDPKVLRRTMLPLQYPSCRIEDCTGIYG